MGSTTRRDASQTSSASVLQALSNDLAAAVERVGRSVVAIHARRRIPASGVVWTPGVIVAAHHTIQQDEDITVTLPDGQRVPATLAGRDPTTDLAVLTTTSDGLTPAEHGGADELRVGTLVLALGRPGTAVTASLGVISVVGAEWRTWQGGRIDQLVRLDLNVYDGFSGGPLVTGSGGGRVLGINTSGLSRAGALTVPVSTVDRVVTVLVREGRVARGYVGLGLQPVQLPEGLVRRLGLQRDVALLVVSVDAGGPADTAGVYIGDVLTAVDGAPVADPSDLLALLGADSLGKVVEVRIVRAGRLEAKSITIGERPRPSGRPGRGRRP